MAQRKPIFLSKSKLIAFNQCARRLWLEIHRSELRVDSAAAQRAFGVGHSVGDLARREYPDGILIGPADPDQKIDWPQVFADTAATLALTPRRPIFEATCRYAGVLIRADLLIPKDEGWHMAEVKSSTSVKDYHVDDVAIQTWVMRNAGVDVSTVELRHIDNQFVYPGDDQYAGLFRAGDVQDRVEALQAEVPRWINDARVVAAGCEPAIAMGAHCRKPYECPFQGYCAALAGMPPEYPLDILPNQKGKALAAQLAAEGYRDLREVPAERITDPALALIRDVTVSGAPYVDLAGARDDLADCGYPRFSFDFETIEFGIPIWKGTRPYEEIPFQWSCHVERSPGTFEHAAFLDLSGNDPSRACAEALLQALETTGPIFAYNAGFERGILTKLADRFPDLAPALRTLCDRLIDPLPIIRQRYYHPDMRGSRSIKDVLPTIAPDLDYAQLDGVQEGLGAGDAFLEAIAPGTSQERRSEIERQLLTYCARDTWAVLVLIWFLEGRGRPGTIPDARST